MCQAKWLASLLLVVLFVGFSCAEPQCQRINKTIADLHLQCGYNYTARYRFDHHFEIASQATVSFKATLNNCSAFADLMMCSLFLPRCTEEIKGPYLPCRGVCYKYANDCKEIIQTNGLEWTVAMCDILPEKDNPQTTKGYRERCFTPPNYKDSGQKYKHNCSDIVIPACQGIPGYTKTIMSPNTQRWYASYIRSKINYIANDTCSPLRKQFVCTENLPACVDGMASFLCRDKCLQFFNTCKSPFSYGSDMCMEFPKREAGSNESAVCKLTHWPRSENWQLPENPTTPISTTVNASGNVGTLVPTTETSGSVSTHVPTTKTSGNVSTHVPTAKTSGNVSMPVPTTKPVIMTAKAYLTGYHWTSTSSSRTSTIESGTKGSLDVQTQKGGKISAGAISGIVFGVILGLVAFVVGALLFRRYKRKIRQYGHQGLMEDMDEL